MDREGPWKQHIQPLEICSWGSVRSALSFASLTPRADLLEAPVSEVNYAQREMHLHLIPRRTDEAILRTLRMSPHPLVDIGEALSSI